MVQTFHDLASYQKTHDLHDFLERCVLERLVLYLLECGVLNPEMHQNAELDYLQPDSVDWDAEAPWLDETHG